MHSGSRVLRQTFALAAAVPFAAQLLAADLTLYPDDDYQGRPLAVVINERHLGALNFDDRASSVVVENGAWELCSDQDFGGRCITLEPGRYASLQALGMDKQVTSVRRWSRSGDSSSALTIPPVAALHESASVVLYARRDYGGASRGVNGAQFNLRSAPLGEDAVSVVVADGNWELCSEPAFNGTCVTLGPGKYPSLQELGLAQGAGSMRRARVPPHSAPRDAAPVPPNAQ